MSVHVHFSKLDEQSDTSETFGIDEDENERSGVNVNQYPNYQSNLHTSQFRQNTETDPNHSNNPMNAQVIDDDEEDIKNLEGKKAENFKQFIYTNNHQFKAIGGGLMILFGGGIHFVWALYRVVEYYHKDRMEDAFRERFIIWSWYIGAIIGSCLSGAIIPKMNKKLIYQIGALLIVCSGIIILLAKYGMIYMLLSRLVGGIAHGLAYVTVMVHATEIAAEEFRELLVIIVGYTVNISILLSIMYYFPYYELYNVSACIGLLCFGLCTFVIVSKHFTETIHFLLMHNGSELEAVQSLAKLRKKPTAAKSIQREFLAIKKVVDDENELIGEGTFLKILLSTNLKSIVLCCYGRICTVFSFNLPMIAMMILFFSGWLHNSLPPHEHLRAVDVTNLNAPDMADSDNIATAITELPPKIGSESVGKNRPKRSDETHGTTETHKEKDTIGTTGSSGTNDAKAAGAAVTESKAVDKGKETLDKATDANKSGKPKEAGSASTNNEKKSKVKEADESSKPKEHTKTKEADKAKENSVVAKTNDANKSKVATEKEATKTDEETKVNKIDEKNKTEETNETTEHGSFFASLLHGHEFGIVLTLWFIFGTISVSVLYALNLRRQIYRFVMVKSAILLIVGIAHAWLKINIMETIMHICLFLYFMYITIPLDAVGHNMLSEAFPMTLQPYSIGFVVSIEHFLHMTIIGLYMNPSFRDRIIIFMLFIIFISYELWKNVPDKYNLPLQVLRMEYQKAQLTFFSKNVNIDKNIANENFY